MGKGFKLAIVFLLALLTIALIAMVELFDVAPIGPNGTEIGFSHLNGAVRDAVGSSTTWYQITELLGVVAILTVGVFGLLGIIQWIRRKSLWKVDRKILFLGGLYIAMAVLYILFEKVVINYRPILMPGETEPEASFPSSHSMLVLVVMGSAMLMLPDYIKNRPARIALQCVCALILVVTVVGRLISGAHWLTDIAGGILIGSLLLAIFSLLTENLSPYKSSK